ncbi:MAG: RagB/SusD family nutrient uptake outer membrane protein [Agriterribacter sp.]
MRILLLYILVFCAILACTGCNKKAFLDTKPDASLVIPATLRDYQAILDNDFIMNGVVNGTGLVPAMGEMGADDYYIPQDFFNFYITPFKQNCVIWAKKIYTGETVWDWNIDYISIFYANTALDGVEKITPPASEQAAWNNIKGSALFYRAHLFYQLAQVFAPPYDKQTAASQWGIPLRLTPTVTETISRATLEESYRKIIADLQTALPLLPAHPLYKTRPCRTAANALLARVYQTMEVYDSALIYANAALQDNPPLLDYNTLDTAGQFSFPRFSEEVIFNATMVSSAGSPYPITTSIGITDTTLLNAYAPDDLRRPVYFRDFGSGYSPIGGLSGGYDFFAGLATDELYLIKSECLARSGNIAEAMNTLNSLLIKRWKDGTFTPLTASTEDEALFTVLAERRKELCFRGLRWTDLRRLNKDSRFAKTLYRYVNDQVYSLLPGDERYTYPIPDDVINFNPAMPQNKRE